MFIGIPWDDSFSLGFKPLDEQHKQIFGVTEEIDEMLRLSAPKDLVVGHFARLRQMLSEHFDYERDLAASLEDGQYAYKAHDACHQKLLIDIDSVIASLETGGSDAQIARCGGEFFECVVRHDGDMVSALVHAGRIKLSDPK